MMTSSLEGKLASLMKHLTDVRRGHNSRDEAAIDSYLDDPEVTNWLTDLDKKGLIRNTRFTYVRPKP